MDRTGKLAGPSRTGRAVKRVVVALVAVSTLVVGPSLVLAAAQTVTLRSEPNVFDAARLTIGVGDTVTWVVAPGTVHTVTSGTYNASGVHPDGLFDSGSLTPGDEFAFTFATAGEFRYVCTIHADSGMVGRITVVEATVADPAGGEPAEAPPSAAVVALILGVLIVVIGVARSIAGRRA